MALCRVYGRKKCRCQHIWVFDPKQKLSWPFLTECVDTKKKAIQQRLYPFVQIFNIPPYKTQAIHVWQLHLASFPGATLFQADAQNALLSLCTILKEA